MLNRLKLEAAPFDDPVVANVSLLWPGIFGPPEWKYFGAIYKSPQGGFVLRGDGKVYRCNDLMGFIEPLLRLTQG